MYFMALAVDYDGTLAYEDKVSDKTIESLIELKASGRKLIMVTGRQLDELKQIFDRLDLFDRIVAENGALIYRPQNETQQLLAEPPPEEFIEKLKTRITPLMTGHVIVSTQKPHETTLLEVIRDMGLELKIIFNKDSVMVLPSGVNKATGLTVALKELGLSMHNVIGIGDAENDHAFLRTVGLGIAVANAYEAIKQSTGFVTKKAYGEGVNELIKLLLEDEKVLISKIRCNITIGVDKQDNPVQLNPVDRVLIAGNSGIGKSTLATALTEKMVENGFQFCIFDPEGDYEKLENAIGVGDVKSLPSQEQVLELLQDPMRSIVVNTLGVELKERPSFFLQLAPRLVSLKGSTGHPHWLIIDEAHHLMPIAQKDISVSLPKEGTILITVHPSEVDVDALKALSMMIILGPQAPDTLKTISQIIGESLPTLSMSAPKENEVLIWQRAPISIIKIVRVDKPKQQHKRHTRKYAEGNLSDEFCFFFRGPNDALNLKAQNLIIFLQIAEGVDDATWMHHLQKRDYSDWFQNHIKDDQLAEATAQIEIDQSLSPAQSRQAIANLVRKGYTAPASTKD
jgi:phosphoglycolate phosphatase (TIGR01487 family)